MIGQCRLCDERPRVLNRQGLCSPCDGFNYYHKVRGHGPAYFLKQQKKVKRWARRYAKLSGIIKGAHTLKKQLKVLRGGKK